MRGVEVEDEEGRVVGRVGLEVEYAVVGDQQGDAMGIGRGRCEGDGGDRQVIGTHY